MRILFIFIFFSINSFADNLVYKNRYYTILFDSASQTFQISNSKNEAIVSSFSIYHSLIELNREDTISFYGHTTSYVISKKENLTELAWKDSNNFCLTTIRFALDQNSEEIKINTTSLYKKKVQVVRDAFFLHSGQSLKEVYRRNSSADKSDFQNEYWLGKEGVRFGDNESTLLIYHVPGISSLQLNTSKNELVVNLDYNKDHPFQYFPLRDSMMNEKEDLSCSIFEAGEKRNNSFSIHVGKQINFVPRLMLNPNGYLAAVIFTEHADWTDLPTHKAVYFGSEEIKNAKRATGGFVKNKIPVTKSVFYANPDNILNNQSRHKSIFTTPLANIKGTKGYLQFLQQLKKEGNEICLHTPDQFTSTGPLIEEACAFMKKNFNAVTWIDHGYNNGPKNNREAFVCDGLNPASPSFAKDIWEKNGVKYFWNSYYEDFKTDDSLLFDFNSSIMHPYAGFGDAAPAPLYWKHPTRTGSSYSWMTRDLLEMPDPDKWSFHFSTERLNDFVQQRAVKFEHCYPAGSIEGSGFWKFDAEKKIVIEPQFEIALQQLASFRDRGLINLTTVRELLDYWIACENIRFDYIDSTSVKITNENKVELKGISFAVAARQITTAKIFQQKSADGDLIFWCDMKAGESVLVSFSE